MLEIKSRHLTWVGPMNCITAMQKNAELGVDWPVWIEPVHLEAKSTIL